MTIGLTREQFLALSWEEQKATDLRKVFDPTTDTNLTANCISAYHQDDTASMVIYDNAAYCFGCKYRWWPDQFLKVLGQRSLVTERGARQQPAPKFIPLAVADTYRRWLWASDGPYKDRQQWLLDRGLTRETCFDNFIGHTGEAYSIPVFATGEGPGVWEHKVQSIRYRRDDELAAEDRPKYWGTAGANQSMMYVPTGIADKKQYGLLLCEGELDALRLVQEGYPAVSLTNGCNALKDEHLPKIRKIVAKLLGNRVTVVYDQDAPGRGATGKALGLMWGAGIEAHAAQWDPLYGKDVTEFLQVSSIRTGRFAHLLEDAWRSGS